MGLSKHFLFAAALCLLPLGAQAAGSAFYPADAARGKDKAASCIACHAVNGLTAGTPPFHIPKLRGQRASSIYYAMLDYKSGARKSDIMAPIASAMNDQDMRDVAAYLAAHGPNRPQGGIWREPPKVQGANSWAHEKVHQVCTFCHGESGIGTLDGVPVIAGQDKAYLIYALRAYKSGERTNGTMGPIASALREDEMEKLAAYFAMQHHLELAK